MRRNIIVEVLRDDSGTSAVEYGILVCCVSTAAILSLTSLGEAVVAIVRPGHQRTDGARALIQEWYRVSRRGERQRPRPLSPRTTPRDVIIRRSGRSP